MADLQWVAALLQGEAAAPKQIGRRQSTGRRQGQRSDENAKKTFSGAETHRYDKDSVEGKRLRGSRARDGDGGGATASNAAGQPPGPAADTPRSESEPQDLSRPGTQSTPRALHCEACDCWVPRRPGDWATHLAGIRHRRQVLSLRVHGERGRLVLSAFESAPSPTEPTHRLVGRAAGAFAGLPQQPQQGGGDGLHVVALPAEQRAALAALRTAALGQLLSMFGHSNVYHAAAAEFQPDRVLEASASLAPSSAAAASGGPAAGGVTTLVAASGSALAATAWLLQRQEGQACAHVPISTLRLLCCSPHESAANPHAVAVQRSTAQQAAMFAGLALVFQELRRSTALQALRLELPQADASLPLEQAWSHALLSLKAAIEQNAALRSVELHLPSAIPGGGSLRGAARRALPGLRDAAAAAAVPARAHVLLALHPRAGRCSLLQLLPLPLVQQVLDLAAPLQPCTVAVP
eukprot:scaffold7.g3415.t1